MEEGGPISRPVSSRHDGRRDGRRESARRRQYETHLNSRTACCGPCRHLPADLVLRHLPLMPGLSRTLGGEMATMLARSRDIVACPVRGRAIAAAYRAGPHVAPPALPAYHALRVETAVQFDQLTAVPGRGGLGIQVELSRTDPYPDADAMAADVISYQRLRVFASNAGGHPFLGADDNNRFRAVHDVFGHLASRRGFDRHGEDAAWFAHAQRYSPLARLAMTTETRGQSSAFIWEFRGQRFPDQKVLLLPARFCDPARVSTRWC